MSDIQSNLNSPAWWFSAVIVALLINMASSYAKPWTDTIFLRLGHRWRTRTEAKRLQFEEQVKRNVENPDILMDSAQRETRSRLRAISLFLLGFFLLNLSNLSAHQTGKSTTFASATALDLIYFGATMVGFVLVMMSLVFMSAADRLEDVATKANQAKISAHSANQRSDDA